MTPFVADADFQLHVGDVREVLAGLPAESVHCVVTSPPYWGLRDYGTGLWEGGNTDCDHAPPKQPERKFTNGRGEGSGDAYAGSNLKSWTDRDGTTYRDICGKCGARRVDQQLGLEPTPDEYVRNMVAVFREVRRVLRRDGTCWLNIGDSYNANVGAGFNANARIGHQNTVLPSGLPAKNLVGIPWRLAFALQADGWYLRSDVIWSKPNPMPESVTDRPTKAHEYLFLLTRSPRYFYDADAIREPQEEPWRSTGKTERGGLIGNVNGMKHTFTNREYNPAGRNKRSVWEIAEQDTLDPSLPPEKPRGPDGRRKTTVTGGEGSIQHRDGERWPAGGANRRSVWNIATEAYPDAHFATFPQALVEPCVLAGTSERGCCPVCGAPWEREVERTGFPEPEPQGEDLEPLRQTNNDADRRRVLSGARHAEFKRQNPDRRLGWRRTCAHDWQLAISPCTVLDPFMGSGTTALVARRLGRNSIGIELNAEYARLCADRLKQLSLFAGVG